MSANKIIRLGPLILTNVLTTNILNPNITSLAGPIGFTMTQPYLIIRHIRISNKTAAAATFSLWIGATGANAAGTEFVDTGRSIDAHKDFDWYGLCRLDAADFLVGGSDTSAALTIQGEAEIGVS